MSSLIDKIPLREVATGKAVSAEVYDGSLPNTLRIGIRNGDRLLLPPKNA